MLKKILSFVLSFMMALGIFNLAAMAADEKPSSWAEKEVTAAIAAKLVPQALQSKYTQPTTRAEFCALAVTLYENIKGKAITERKTFADTKDETVEKAGGIGVATALGEGKFYPTAKITREHVAIMTARLAKALGKDLPKKAATYDDKSSISASALESVGQVQAAGLMVEAGNKKFVPKEPYTREQSIVTIMRTYAAVRNSGLSESTKPTDPPVSGKIDPKLVGHWQSVARKMSGGQLYRYWLDYYFYEDGTFDIEYMFLDNMKGNGKYSVSGNLIYFKDLIMYLQPIMADDYRDVPEKNFPRELVMEYLCGADSDGEYLHIKNMCDLGDANEQGIHDLPSKTSGDEFRRLD